SLLPHLTLIPTAEAMFCSATIHLCVKRRGSSPYARTMSIAPLARDRLLAAAFAAAGLHLVDLLDLQRGGRAHRDALVREHGVLDVERLDDALEGRLHPGPHHHDTGRVLVRLRADTLADERHLVKRLDLRRHRRALFQ